MKREARHLCACVMDDLFHEGVVTRETGWLSSGVHPLRK